MVPQSERSKGGGRAGTTRATGVANNCLPRPQSSLELLSQTAAVMEHSPQPSFTHSSSNCSIVDLHLKIGSSSCSSSPKESARGVTPTNSLPTDLNMANQAPSLPEMSKKRQQSQPVFLEQKRSSFFPSSLLGEGALDGSTDVEGRAGTPLYYSPGLFLTYSNGSTSNGVWNNSGGPPPPTVATATDSGSSEPAGGDAVVPNFLTSQGSFTSSGSLASAPSYAFVGSSTSLSVMPPTAAFGPPPSNLAQTNRSFLASDDYQHDNLAMCHQLAVKDATINSLQKQVDALQREIRELRQLPTGKISQIPVEYVALLWLVCALVDYAASHTALSICVYFVRDMLTLMHEYGSEISDTAMPPRKQNVQKASVVRQFRRWNPNFLDWFEYRSGQWVPKLGKVAELQRRELTRREAAEDRRKKVQDQKQLGSDASVKSESNV